MRRWVQIAFSMLLAIASPLPAAGSPGAEAVIITPLVDLPEDRRYESYVAETLQAAELSIDLVLSSAQLDDVSLWSCLIAAQQRGVVVRALFDCSDWAPSITERNRPVLEALRLAGIDARFDDPEITTHAKLLVVDEQTSIIGSSNWNAHALQQQWQAAVAIGNRSVAASFTQYVDRLWSDTLAPGGVLSPTPTSCQTGPTIIPLPDTDDSVNYASWLLPHLTTAERSIHVVMYRASYYAGFGDSESNRILDALIRANARGVDVRVILDDCAPYPDNARDNLEAALLLSLSGVDVRLDRPETTTHAKLVIIDGRDVFVGSTNWNYYALERNNEASIALLEMPTVAGEFERLFVASWEAGIPVR